MKTLRQSSPRRRGATNSLMLGGLALLCLGIVPVSESCATVWGAPPKVDLPIPAVTGMQALNAKALLEDFTVVTWVKQNAVPYGNAAQVPDQARTFFQSPAPTTTPQPVTTPITVRVFADVALPDFRGMTVGEATTEANAYGYYLAFYDATTVMTTTTYTPHVGFVANNQLLAGNLPGNPPGSVISVGTPRSNQKICPLGARTFSMRGAFAGTKNAISALLSKGQSKQPTYATSAQVRAA